jgi:hypothetical protein
MRPIPILLKKEILADPYYKKCARRNKDCKGRITWEHAWIYSGRQINEKWAIIPLCVFHHLGEGLDKMLNCWLSLKRATATELLKYPKVNWLQKIKFLNKKYGKEVL